MKEMGRLRRERLFSQVDCLTFIDEDDVEIMESSGWEDNLSDV